MVGVLIRTIAEERVSFAVHFEWELKLITGLLMKHDSCMKESCGKGSAAFEAIALTPALLIGASATRSVSQSLPSSKRNNIPHSKHPIGSLRSFQPDPAAFGAIAVV